MIIRLKGDIPSSPSYSSPLQSLVYIITYQSLLELDWILRSWLSYIHTPLSTSSTVSVAPALKYINASTCPHFISKCTICHFLTIRQTFSSRKYVFVLLLVPQTRFRVLLFFAMSCTLGTICLSRSLSCAMFFFTSVFAHTFIRHLFPHTHIVFRPFTTPICGPPAMPCSPSHFQYICRSCSHIFTVVSI